MTRQPATAVMLVGWACIAASLLLLSVAPVVAGACAVVAGVCFAYGAAKTRAAGSQRILLWVASGFFLLWGLLVLLGVID